MKGIETAAWREAAARAEAEGSDHCPAMKGIETQPRILSVAIITAEATTAPQ